MASTRRPNLHADAYTLLGADCLLPNAACLVAALIVVAAFAPETRGKTIAAIQREMTPDVPPRAPTPTGRPSHRVVARG